jgi:hypothetical protein
MTDEDKAFLEKAFEAASAMIEDMNKLMAEAIGQLKSPERTNESIITALEIMDRCCDDPDCARNIEVLDGLQTLIDIIRDWPEKLIKVRALEILALMLSNNPNIQAHADRRGAMEVLVKHIQEAPAGSDLRSKAFRCCAALVRGVDDLQKKFVSDFSGASLAVTCLGTKEEESLRGKAASLLRDLIQQGCIDGEAITEVVPVLAVLIGSSEGEMQYREQLAGCAFEVTEPGRAADLKSLVAAIDQRLKQLKEPGMDDFSEEKTMLVQCAVRARKAVAAATAT